MSVQTVRIIAVLGALSIGAGPGVAEDAGEPDEDLRRIIERLEQQDRQARESGFVLDSFEVERPPNDPRRRSMQLSIGRADGKSGMDAFGERPSTYQLDPLEPRDTPPVGLNLKLQF